MRASKKRRVTKDTASAVGTNESTPVRAFSTDPTQAATQEERHRWHGWVEIESDPAFFNVMLREFGVQDVNVKEIVSLEAEFLTFLPRPIYGLIFLFRYHQVDDSAKEETECPSGIWFANQTVSNACASVSLLNIINNVPGIELGDHLQHFKEFTTSLTPALRGDAIANFEFIKQIHNSFARKMDMLNGDLFMKRNAESTRKKRKAAEEVDELGGAFHFIAFIPIDGVLWKLDGLDNQPCNLGPVGCDDWLEQVKPDLQARMAGYESEQIEFAILGIVRNPLENLVSSLAANVKTLQAVDRRLDELMPGWKAFEINNSTLLNADESYQLRIEDISNASVEVGAQNKCSNGSAEDLMALRQELLTAQAGLKMSIKEEQDSRRSDEDKAAGRRHDYGPAVNAWLHYHAAKRVVKEMLESK